MAELSAVVLRNKGVPVELYRLDDEGEPAEGGKREKVWIRFTAVECAEIEEAFDRVSFLVDEPRVVGTNGDAVLRVTQVEKVYQGLDGWQASMDRKRTNTMIRTLAIVLHRDEKAIAKSLIIEEMKTYDAAVGAAWGMANGLDPEVAGKMFAVQMTAARKNLAEQDRVTLEGLAKIEEAVANLTTPGESGSKDGSDEPTQGALAEELTSSGV